MAEQIMGIYSPEYVNAEGNEYSKLDKNLWWSSRNANALEWDYFEIDLSKPRSVNYISFDIIKKPIDIEIQYDRISLENLDQYSNSFDSRWVTVKKIYNQSFDDSVSYNADAVNPWKHCEFYFTDQDGMTAITRRIRIKFTRRNENWPTKNFSQFPYSIDIKNFRTGRYISRVDNVRGFIIDTSSYSEVLDFNSEIRQRFAFPESAVFAASPTADLTNIDSFLPTNIVPKMLGFEVLVKPKKQPQSIGIEWKFLDITNNDIVLAEGVKRFTSAERPTADSGQTTSSATQNEVSPEWIRVNFNKPVASDSNARYEIRIKNIIPDSLSGVYAVSPNPNKVSGLPEQNDLYVDNSGNITRKENKSIVYRVISDIGNFGKDFLGNEYREGVRYNLAQNANDGKTYTNWTCFPNPSEAGVEALYFDVRKNISGDLFASVIDAIEINTLTPGVKMNVYFSRQETADHPPEDIDDWENILWTPVRENYRLNQKQIIDLPYPIAANWICLEFYNLQPTPLNLSNYPVLPNVIFKEFPNWVYENNPVVPSTNNQPGAEQKEKFVSFTIKDVVDPQIENSFGKRIYKETKQTFEENLDFNGFGSADPSLLSKISFSKNPYADPTIYMSDTSTALGASVHGRFISDYSQTYIAEAKAYPRVVDSRSVSNLNNRFDATRVDERNLSFNRVAAHQYAVKTARYNKKAYVVSISEVNFLRKDYTTETDDPFVHDVLVYESADQSAFIEYSSWQFEEKNTIPPGKPIYVTYTVGEETYTDEYVLFEESGSPVPSYEPVDLVGHGGIATSAIARSSAFGEGKTYYRDKDFLIVYDAATKTNKIKRDDIPARLTVPNIVHSIDRYAVLGSAIIITEVTNDDDIEIGAKEGLILSAGASSSSATLGFDTSASSLGGATIYVTELTVLGPGE